MPLMKFDLLRIGLAAVALIAVPAAVHAHGSMKPKHGGLVQMSGETMIELATTPKGVDVYLSEEDKPTPTAGVTAKLAQTAAGKRTETVLKPAGGNKLSAPGFKPARAAKLVVTIIDKSGAKVFATFQTK
jgi:hypothetical protein